MTGKYSTVAIDIKQNWQVSLLSESGTIGEAIRNLNVSGLQIVLVVSSDGVLQGTVTDGDIRRSLIRGSTINSSIQSAVFRDSLVLPMHFDREQALKLMQANRIRQLPVVDASRRVVDLQSWDDLLEPTQRSNLMVIMAGGQGIRLRPYTANCPKPMLLVGDKPLLEHIIERAKSEGFGHFLISIHYLGHIIEEYFGDGSRWQVNIEYLREEAPLGTAGAIHAINKKIDRPFIVANGDVLTDIRYGELLDFHCRYSANATMAVRMHEWQHPFGVVLTSGLDIVGFDEKPIERSYVNAGLYVLEPSVLEVLEGGKHVDMPSLFMILKERGLRTIVYPTHEAWHDVGREEDLIKAQSVVGS